MKRALVVEDDPDIVELIVHYLRAEGFEVEALGDGRQALERLRAGGHDVVILDLQLPGLDGLALCAELRRDKRTRSLPVIMLTGSDTEADIVSGLDAGANDYIAKPFRLNELLARMRAQLRGYDSSEDAVFKVGPYLFRPSAKQLHDQARGKRIRLTEKESAIIKFLLRAGEQVVSRDVLLHDVWGYNAGVTTHTLETHVYRLRQKIERDPSHAEILVTEGGGYKLVP